MLINLGSPNQKIYMNIIIWLIGVYGMGDEVSNEDNVGQIYTICVKYIYVRQYIYIYIYFS